MYPTTYLQQLLIHGQMFHIYPYPLSTHSCGLLDTNSRYFIISYRCISLKDKDLNKFLQFCYHTKKINSNSFFRPAVSIILYLQSAINTGNVFWFCFFSLTRKCLDVPGQQALLLRKPRGISKHSPVILLIASETQCQP